MAFGPFAFDIKFYTRRIQVPIDSNPKAFWKYVNDKSSNPTMPEMISRYNQNVVIKFSLYCFAECFSKFEWGTYIMFTTVETLCVSF